MLVSVFFGRIISAPTELNAMHTQIPFWAERTKNIVKRKTFASAFSGGAEPHPYGANKLIQHLRISPKTVNCKSICSSGVCIAAVNYDYTSSII